MLVKLSDLLREVLRRHDRAWSRWMTNSMAETYLELARIRFGDRLRVIIDVDAEARDALVPVLSCNH
jgi:LytS/YehU family sensor histidine kinase